MHHIPRFFVRSQKRKDMDAKQKARVPRLDRRLAKKYIEYEPTASSSDEELSPLRTRSLDLSPLGDRTSFRVQGIDGEFDIICRSLGLSGPDDFAIPMAAWEARKVRSSSDLLQRSRLQQLDSPKVDTVAPQMEHGGANELSAEFIHSVRVSDAAGSQSELAELNDSTDVGIGNNGVCELSNRFRNYARDGSGEAVGCPVIVESSRNGGGGIKGVRPPVLAPPPSISLPVIDNLCSTWDILRSFAPDGDNGSSYTRRLDSSDDEEDEETVKQKEANGVTLGETAVFSESCSFTTSNDDDSSSTTTEPTSNISPNVRFRRIITYWEKGELLGRGSFGSVYEGIAE